MEATIRGLIERNIERITETEQLAMMAGNFRESFPVSSMEDCLFGYVIGSALVHYLGLEALSRKKELTLEEVKKFWDILKGRTMYIKGRIKLALNK